MIGKYIVFINFIYIIQYKRHYFMIHNSSLKLLITSIDGKTDFIRFFINVEYDLIP